VDFKKTKHTHTHTNPPKMIFKLELYIVHSKHLSGESSAEAQTELEAKRDVDVSWWVQEVS